jgi:hypothetical protein
VPALAPVHRWSLALLTLALFAWAPVPVRAQYFGQNKVQYQRFDFRILETPHFDVYYYPDEQAGARQAAVLAERWYSRLSELLGHQLRRRQPLVLYASHADFVQTNVVSEALGDGTGGVTEGARNRMALPFGLTLAETDHVIGHELVHAFQYDLAHSGHPSIPMMPLWFVEGMAEFYSVPEPAGQTAMWMRDAVRSGRLPTVKALENPKYFPYRYGHALWQFIADRHGRDTVARLLRAKSGSLAGRFKEVLGITLADLTREWHEDLRARYAPRPEPVRAGIPLHPLVDRQTGGRMNIGPALSPDARRLAFVSEKDLFSIEVFLADTATGRVERKLLKRTANPHFDSLEFVDSAGTWDPHGRRFAFPAVKGGRPVLVLVDADAGGTAVEIPFPSLGRICDPAWSPDGTRIAFSASSGGWSDLYVYDLDRGTLSQLTRDAFADLQPSWSPDGRALAFATDRFSTDLAALRAGQCRLAMLDLGTGAIREVPGTAGGRNIDPQWGDQGRALYFIGDPDGTANVFRLGLEDGTVAQVTSVPTGVTGITALSPALSVAGSRLALSVYSNGEYQIVTGEVPRPGVGLVASQVEAAQPFTPSAFAAAPDMPVNDPETGFGARRYRRRLSLEGIGEPYITAGGGAFGSFLQAGSSVWFGDMLGDQQLGLAVQGGRRLEDFAARLLYVNRRARWNWGLSADFLPAVFATSAGRLTPRGDAIEQDVEFEKQYHTSAGAVAIYPFNRAHRLEVTGGWSHVAFGREIAHQVRSITSGKTVSDHRESLPGASGIDLLHASAALVYDSAVFGGTSPILGRRYRVEVAPSLGSLSFTTVLADFRQYIVPFKPLTIALRARYAARVGSGAVDPRLLPLVLTLRGEVRGYELREVAATPCLGRAAGSCSILDVLRGSSLFSGNAEIRVPVPGIFTRSYSYGPFPMEAFVFADGVSLGTSDGRSEGGWASRRQALRSAGLGLRVNTAGIVFEFAAARRFDHPWHGWALAFNIGPGF